MERRGTLGWPFVEPAVADLDGDGVLDLVGGTEIYVAWQRGRGDGTFEVGQPIDASVGVTLPARAREVTNLVVGDFDGDGDNDVVVGPGRLRFYRNPGDGAFQGRHLAAVHELRPGLALRAVDLDGDGAPDLLDDRSERRGRPGWYRNEGMGAMGERRELDILTGCVEPADLDGDGVLELLVCGDGGVGIWTLADGLYVLDRTLLPEREVLQVGAGDLNGDGEADVVARVDGGLLVVAGGADPVALPEAAFHVLDHDGDGVDELLVGTAGAWRLLRGVLDAEPPEPMELVLPEGVRRLVDVDGDALPDVLAERTWQRNIAPDGFAAPTPLSGIEVLAVADLDGERIPDLVGVAEEREVWIRGLGGGAFAELALPLPGLRPRTHARWMEVADMDGDGLSDVVLDSGFWSGLADVNVAFWLRNEGLCDPPP